MTHVCDRSHALGHNTGDDCRHTLPHGVKRNHEASSAYAVRGPAMSSPGPFRSKSRPHSPSSRDGWLLTALRCALCSRASPGPPCQGYGPRGTAHVQRVTTRAQKPSPWCPSSRALSRTSRATPEFPRASTPSQCPGPPPTLSEGAAPGTCPKNLPLGNHSPFPRERNPPQRPITLIILCTQRLER